VAGAMGVRPFGSVRQAVSKDSRRCNGLGRASLHARPGAALPTGALTSSGNAAPRSRTAFLKAPARQPAKSRLRKLKSQPWSAWVIYLAWSQL
jgi:hypothetical protein